jgi:hypothetical protein
MFQQRLIVVALLLGLLLSSCSDGDWDGIETRPNVAGIWGGSIVSATGVTREFQIVITQDSIGTLRGTYTTSLASLGPAGVFGAPSRVNASNSVTVRLEPSSSSRCRFTLALILTEASRLVGSFSAEAGFCGPIDNGTISLIRSG